MQQLSALSEERVDGLTGGNKQLVITCVVEAELEPLWLIGSVIIQVDLCTLYAIMLYTELSNIFHLSDCKKCVGKRVTLVKWLGKRAM